MVDLSMTHFTLVAFILLFIPDGMTKAPNPNIAPSRVNASCDAGQYQALVGRKLSSIEAGIFPELLRVVPIGAMMTMDFIEARLNVQLDTDDTILRIWCG